MDGGEMMLGDSRTGNGSDCRRYLI
jgi:hypothetical protein